MVSDNPSLNKYVFVGRGGLGTKNGFIRVSAKSLYLFWALGFGSSGLIRVFRFRAV